MKNGQEFLPIAASKLRARAVEIEFERCLIHDHSDHRTRRRLTPMIEAIGWAEAIKEYNCPGVLHWPEGRVPPTIVNQLIGQTIDTGMTVTWRGERYLVVDINILPEELYCPCDHLIFELYCRPMTIAPAKCIDLCA
jgi:hypothetical protein